MLERIFEITTRGSTVRRELTAGLTTFLTMSYIIFVNPAMLAQAGMDQDAVFAATCVSSAVGCLIMGLYANYPIALAPGMGLNAFFTHSVVMGMGYSWEAALGAVFISGVLFLILSLTPVREWIINAIPSELKMAISAGVGLFLILIGLTNAGLVTDHPATLIGLGDLGATPVFLAIGCFILIAALETLKIPGAIAIGMGAATIAGVALGQSQLGGVSLPPSVAPTFLAFDLDGAMELGMIAVIFAFLIVDIFDTAGTLVGVSHQAGFIDADGKIPQIRKTLIADSTATVVGAALGTSPVTSYIESVAGVRSGGRTGLTSVVVALLFLAALFLAPLAASIQSYATGPALVYVGCVMLGGLRRIDWSEPSIFIPAAITATMMPLTYSIATGIGFGMIAHVAIHLFGGKLSRLNPAVAAIAGLFLLKFIFLGG